MDERPTRNSTLGEWLGSITLGSAFAWLANAMSLLLMTIVTWLVSTVAADRDAWRESIGENSQSVEALREEVRSLREAIEDGDER